MVGLRRLRLAAGLTQAQVARSVGITQNYYCELENGRKKNPTTAVILSLAKTLSCNIDALYMPDVTANSGKMQ